MQTIHNRGGKTTARGPYAAHHRNSCGPPNISKYEKKLEDIEADLRACGTLKQRLPCYFLYETNILWVLKEIESDEWVGHFSLAVDIMQKLNE